MIPGSLVSIIIHQLRACRWLSKFISASISPLWSGGNSNITLAAMLWESESRCKSACWDERNTTLVVIIGTVLLLLSPPNRALSFLDIWSQGKTTIYIFSKRKLNVSLGKKLYAQGNMPCWYTQETSNFLMNDMLGAILERTDTFFVGAFLIVTLEKSGEHSIGLPLSEGVPGCRISCSMQSLSWAGEFLSIREQLHYL